ncbi:reverse transcriptase domain-containing protein, partial [Tanacetum coccineum]
TSCNDGSYEKLLEAFIGGLPRSIEGMLPPRSLKLSIVLELKLKRLLTNKYCPRTEVRKMEDELYNLTVKGNDLKSYVRRFQELVVLCPNMVPNTEKLLEAFIGGLPRSIKGNVTASMENVEGGEYVSD